MLKALKIGSSLSSTGVSCNALSFSFTLLGELGSVKLQRRVRRLEHVTLADYLTASAMGARWGPIDYGQVWRQDRWFKSPPIDVSLRIGVQFNRSA